MPTTRVCLSSSPALSLASHPLFCSLSPLLSLGSPQLLLPSPLLYAPPHAARATNGSAVARWTRRLLLLLGYTTSVPTSLSVSQFLRCIAALAVVAEHCVRELLAWPLPCIKAPLPPTLNCSIHHGRAASQLLSSLLELQRSLPDTVGAASELHRAAMKVRRSCNGARRTPSVLHRSSTGLH